MCAAITAVVFLAAFAAFAVDPKDLESWGMSAADNRELLDNIELMILLPLLPLVLWLLRVSAESDIKTHTFQVDEALLPELMAQVEDYARALGMRRVPKLYIAAGTLPTPALQSFAPKARLLVLPASMAAAGGDGAGLRDFYPARKMAELRLGYSGVWRNSLLLIPRLLNLPGNALARAQTYSADALAAQLAPTHAPDTMLNDIFGSALYPKVNREIYRARWQAASAFSFDQIFSDLPLPRERYLAVMRQLDSAVPYPSDGRLF